MRSFIYCRTGMKGGRMHYITVILIVLIWNTADITRELGHVLDIILKYRRRHK